MAQFRIKNGLIIDNGGISVTGSISSTAGITGSFSGSIAGFPTDVSSFSSSLSTRITSTEATASQYVAASGSLSTRTTAVEATSSQYVAASGSFSTRLTTDGTSIASINAKTGSFATTGSNYFIGTQVITGSVYIANDLIVQGSSSLQNITASAVSIGTNTVILNTDSPAVRFAGISVRDSGSNSGVTSSIWYDSLNNKWIYQNESGSSYSGGMFISGPRNTGSLGDEASMTNGYIAKGLGGDHIGPSIIFESASAAIGINTDTPDTLLTVNGVSGTKSLALVNSTGGTRADFTITENTGLILNAYEGASARSIDLKVGGVSALTIASSQAATFASSVTAAGNGFFGGAATFSGLNGGISLNGSSNSGINFRVADALKGYLYTASNNMYLETTSGNIILAPNGNPALTIATTGAATFSSSVTVTGNNAYVFQGAGATTGYQAAALSNSGGAINYGVANSSGVFWGSGGGGAYYGTIGTTNATAFVIATNNAGRMLIDSSGNVGIGTTSPFAVLTSQAPSSGAIGLGIVGRASDDYGLITFRKNDASTTVVEIGGNIANGFFFNNYANTFTSFATNSTERMRISPTGTLSINSTAGPVDDNNQKLHVYGAIRQDVLGASYGEGIAMNFPTGGVTYGGIFMHSTTANSALGAGTIKWQMTYNYAPEIGTGGGGLAFTTTNTNTRMLLTSGGKLLVGTTTAGYGLFTEQRVTINPTNDGITVAPLTQNKSAYTLQADNNTGNRYGLYIANGSSSEVGSVSFTSSAVSFNTTSDYRLKEDLKAVNGLEIVNKINVYNYKWKISDDRMDGVLAHELQDILPYAVMGIKDGDKMQSVDYSKIVPVLIASIKELSAKVAALEAQQ